MVEETGIRFRDVSNLKIEGVSFGSIFGGNKDSWAPIKDEHIDKIFQIYQRLHSRADYDGTGIGLAVCRKIIERHAGKIWVESTFGEGSTFKFTLMASSGSD